MKIVNLGFLRASVPFTPSLFQSHINRVKFSYSDSKHFSRIETLLMN